MWRYLRLIFGAVCSLSGSAIIIYLGITNIDSTRLRLLVDYWQIYIISLFLIIMGYFIFKINLEVK